MKSLDQRQKTGIIIAVIGVASIVSMMFAMTLFTPAKPAVEFIQAVDPPQEISNLTNYMSRGCAVVLFSTDICPPCEGAKSTLFDLQRQYPDVNFASWDLSINNTAVHSVGIYYGIMHVPSIVVVRGDGAFAKFEPANTAEGGTLQGMDIRGVKSAIEAAQEWHKSHSTWTPISTPLPVVDYSDYYDKFWKEAVIENPFYKTTNERGNNVYIGVTRQAAKQFKNTIVIEHVGSQNEAARFYKDEVAKATSDGYVNRAFNFPANPPNLIERWQGDKGVYSYFYAAYYYSYGVNSWVFEKQYI